MENIYQQEIKSRLLQLREELRSLCVPDNHYSLGHVLDERTCLIERNGAWLVFYSERGRMEDLHTFSSFDEARKFILMILNS